MTDTVVEPVPALEMLDISKSFPGVKALDSATLTILPGEVHGLVGENGAGKSTIIKTLAGVYQHDEGSVRIAGDEITSMTPAVVHQRGIRFVHQELHLVPHFSVTESVFMGHEMQGPFGLRAREMRTRAERTLAEVLGVHIDGRRLIRDLGPAERKLVQIARALVDDGARLVVFDEPTAPLAAVEVDRVLQAVRRLRDRGIAILYVSHYLGEITDICDRVTVFRNGTDVGVVDQIDDSSGRELIRMMVGREIDQLFPERTPAPGEVALEIDGLGDGRQFDGVSLTVAKGEVVGVAGLLGSGSEEFVDTLIGLRAPKRGRISIGGRKINIISPAVALRHGMVLIPRDRRHDGLVLDMSVTDNINLATLDDVSSAGILRRSKALDRAKSMVQKLDIRPANPAATTRLLSGGNQQKVVLGRALAADASVFILDEPTVGVDIGAKAEIYRLVADVAARGAAVIVSSNDPAEILGLCDRVVVMLRGSIVADAPAGAFTRDELVATMTASNTEERIVHD
jgi:ribose transport system ATP-binding protein